jgi:WD40 repeat protein
MLAITYGADIEIWDWDGTTLGLSQTLSGSQTQLVVSWSPYGNWLASADGFAIDTQWVSTVRFWNTELWQPDATAEGLYLITGGYPFASQMNWNPNSTAELTIIGDMVYQVEDQYFLGPVARINFVDAVSGVLFNHIPFTSNYFAVAAAWRPQGDWIAVGKAGAVTLYDSSTGNHFPVTALGEGFNVLVSPEAMDWTDDGRYLAADDVIYDFVEKKYIGGFKRPEPAGIQDVDWHPDDVRLATANTRGLIKVEDASLLTSFIPPASSLTAFTLIDANTNQPIAGLDPIPADVSINLDTLGTGSFAIRANTDPATVGSVVFELNGTPSTDNSAPYTVPLPGVGSYTLSATPYSGADGTGDAGTPLTLNFTVVD